MSSDAELILKCQQGEAEAFNILVTRYQDRIYNTAYRFTGNAEDAADITQQAFINAYGNIKSFRKEASFVTWLHSITFNLFVSERRKLARKKTVSLDNEQGGFASTIPAVATGDSGANREALQEILASLDEEDRRYLILKEIDGYKYREIADILGVPVGTVHGKIHRIRMALREKLKSRIDIE